VAGKDLSRIIHVDEALISKWRHNKRVLRAGSGSAEKIVDFFLSIDRRGDFARLKKLLAGNYREIMAASEAEISVYLKKWLTDPQQDSGMSDLFESLEGSPDVDITISYHLGKNSGRRMAVKFFNEYAKQRPESTEVIIFSTEDGSWFHEDEAFKADWRKLYDELLDAGKIIKVIHPVNRSYEQMADSLITWLPIHLTGKTVDYYIPNYADDPVNYTYILMPGQLAITGSSSAHYSKHLDSWVTNDEHILKNTAQIVQEYINRSRPLFTRYYIDSGAQYYNELMSIIQRRNTRYFHSAAPLYAPLPETLLEEILRRNGLGGEDVRKTIENYSRLSSLNVSIPNHYVISMKSAEKNLRAENVEMHAMTYLAATRIVVDQELYRRVVRESFKAIRNLATIEAGLISASQRDDFEDITVMAQENTGVQFIGAQMGKPFVIMLHEATFIIAIMERIKASWREIPAIMKDKDFICDRIDELISAN
ncbi:MAG: hypothetical protein FWG03_06915, partial [Clostridiales bacterium]|nr:hypothetical protein [Clostridiales bacterium]